LWFCTNEGLFRFDQYEFVNYGRADGFSDPNVYDILETRDGNYWIGTAAGLYLLNRKAAARPRLSKFTAYSVGPEGANWINVLLEDASGIVWVGTRTGLFRLRRPSVQGTSAANNNRTFEPVGLSPRADRSAEGEWITAMLHDKRGAIWIGSK